jgi:hypothetical protein
MDNVVVEQFSFPQSTEAATLHNGGKELTEDACPHCRSIIRNRRALPGPDVSRLHPSTIPNTHITVDEWKKATNEAIKQRLETRYNDVVHVLLLTWKANDIGSKAPDPGSLVLDEAKELEHVFTDLYGYKTKLFEIPSDSPQLRLQLLFSEILLELDQERQNSKRPLLVVYYNGHGRRSENPHFLDHLIFAA